MASSIRDFVMAQPLFDAHEHLVPLPDFAKFAWELPAMISYAGADLTTARGPLNPNAPPPPAADSPEFPAYFFAAWENARNTGYCRAIERACRDLTGMEFRLENAAEIRSCLSRQVAPDPTKWYCDTLRKKTGIAWVIKDAVNLPESVAEGLYPDFFRAVYRDDVVLCLCNRDDIAGRERRWKRSVYSLDDLIAGWMQTITDCLATGKVTAFKIGVAYRRDLAFRNPGRDAAERAFNRLMTPRSREPKGPPSAAGPAAATSPPALRPLHDYLTHLFIRRATEERLPIQVHTGYLAGNWQELGGVNPISLTPLLRMYPETRFDLFHAGWPHHDIMVTIGKSFPNVWVNLCWAWAMNPITMEHALDALLDAVPHNKIIAFGADATQPLATYGFATQAREGIARVLERRIARGDMEPDFAERVARRIILENAVELHGLAQSPGNR